MKTNDRVFFYHTPYLTIRQRFTCIYSKCKCPICVVNYSNYSTFNRADVKREQIMKWNIFRCILQVNSKWNNWRGTPNLEAVLERKLVHITFQQGKVQHIMICSKLAINAMYLLCIAGFIQPVRNYFAIMTCSLILFPQLSLTQLPTKENCLT